MGLSEATDDLGFAALPAGYYVGTDLEFGRSANFWGTTAPVPDDNNKIYLYYLRVLGGVLGDRAEVYTSQVAITSTEPFTRHFRSVRCILDAAPTE